ncbi:IscS subfamily cysteine desulfurase [Bacterioplanes sanyensis]|uniref:cysteine desulfurase n=1 Tax=Bacterioplanes sanyensis TaxID=1249553 RepID=A0A222FLX0_9GAMM|nr:aminotransferase class V-fold PLP-dependent enzyme [Bacterioplanes sanyensis]ASP39223.1 IscS subfamily cysteine desulfurase [Bacterioplanes sanyensis]
MTPVYLDYAASAPVDPVVAEAMSACMTLEGNFGNPASRSHRFGWKAEQAVEKARGQVAQAIGAESREIVWTSGATESNNLAIKGVVEAALAKLAGPVHIITSAIEHKAVLDPCQWLARRPDVELTLLAPDADGLIRAEQVAQALRDNTVLVSLMSVNNELGTITDVAKVGRLLADHPAVFHVDAAQALGKLPVDVNQWQVDLLSLSAHKVYGPKGMGALYVRREPQPELQAQIHGGGHERGFRSGTLATHQIVGFGVAAELAIQQLEVDSGRIRELRDRLWQALQTLGGVFLNGHYESLSPNHLNVSFDAVDGEVLLASLAKIAVSSGSACNSASVAPSYVLKAIGRSDALAHAGIRFSVGRFTSSDDIDATIAEVQRVVRLLRGER